MTATVLDARGVMEAWLANGEVENPAHSNCNDISREFGIGCVAWCCETWWLMLKHIGIDVPKEAAVGAAMQDAQAGRGGLLWLPRTATIQEGDGVCYDWKGAGNWSDMHIAAFVRDPGTQSRFLTIAGNENDRITEQWRDRTYVTGFIRPPYRSAPAPTPTPVTHQEDDVRPFIVKLANDTTAYLIGGIDPTTGKYVALQMADANDLRNPPDGYGPPVEITQASMDARVER